MSRESFELREGFWTKLGALAGVAGVVVAIYFGLASIKKPEGNSNVGDERKGTEENIKSGNTLYNTHSPASNSEAETEYPIPLGISETDFVSCMGNRVVPLRADIDFRIVKTPAKTSAIVPLSNSGEVTTGYADCRIKLAKR